MKRIFHLNFVGDVMLGRLIDQLFPQHVNDPDKANTIASFRAKHECLRQYDASSPWGSTLPLFHSADLNLINLETSVTTHPEPWPGKAFNYRTHPSNAFAVLRRARIDFTCLANNHTLDFGPEGLVETVWTLKQARIGLAGAGETTEEAIRPSILSIPRGERGIRAGGQRENPTSQSSRSVDGGGDTEDMRTTEVPTHAVHVWSASDHPRGWGIVPTFHLIDYTTATRSQLKRLLTRPDPSGESSASSRPSLKVISIHWGPNYRWHPSDEIRSLAHFLIDECDVDIVHGHSSHHVQGVEVARPGKLIIYGCGDFIDDYALNTIYRNDLSAVWRVRVKEEREGEEEGVHAKESGNRMRLRPDRLEIFPTRIQLFQAHLLDRSDPDHDWVQNIITVLTGELMESSPGNATKAIIQPQLGEQGQLIVDLN